ncbi:hypothetical protein VSP20_01485 [Myroides phaeus]|uniref:hypothetical protein n=1 Tax=Myroides phaeus TaxID=702745 RepID=UPI002DB73B46|nr:hypothetical protein [Myroides phaeus]MEC4115629.1 hypothetical protein [Myroides phaeus]
MLKRIFEIALLLFFTYLLIGCTYEMKKVDNTLLSNRWRGEFIVQNRKVPFVFSLEKEQANVYGYRVLVVNGDQYEQLETVHMQGKNFRVELSYDQEDVLEGKINGNVINGKLRKRFSDSYLEALFTAHKSNDLRFTEIKKPTSIIPDGIWLLQYDTLKNLKNTADLFRHNIDRFESLQLFRKDNEIFGSIIPAEQGFEGVMTTNGFICSSFYKSEPYLMEGEFINDKEFIGTITTMTDIYTFKALKKSDSEVIVKKTDNIFSTLILLVKAYFEHL